MAGEAAGDRRPKVLFVINSLAGGGAERVMATILAASGPLTARYDMRLVLLDEEPEAYPPPEWMPVERLDTGGKLAVSARRLRMLVRQWRPDVAVSFLTRSNIATALAVLGTGCRWVGSERVDTSAHLGRGWRGAIARALVRASYRRADRLIAVSSGVAAGLRAHYGVRPERIVVIDNPVDHARLAAQRAAPCPEFDRPSPLLVVSAGRLVPNKNFDLLVRAYARSGLPGDLVIAGQGEERPRLQGTIAALGLEGRVHLPGFLANPFALFGRADLFVLPSNAEGFPNTLVEAMACGLPVIATNCPSGPAEILARSAREGIGGLTVTSCGILVPPGDVAAMTSALRRMADPKLRGRLAAAALHRSRDFGVEQATARYWSVVADTLRAPAGGRRTSTGRPRAQAAPF